MKVFDYEQWPSSFGESEDARKSGIEEISNLTQFYFKHKFITQDEQKLAKKHWPLFREKILKSKQRPTIDAYKEFACRKGDDMRGYRFA